MHITDRQMQSKQVNWKTLTFIQKYYFFIISTILKLIHSYLHQNLYLCSIQHGIYAYKHNDSVMHVFFHQTLNLWTSQHDVHKTNMMQSYKRISSQSMYSVCVCVCVLAIKQCGKSQLVQTENLMVPRCHSSLIVASSLSCLILSCPSSYLLFQ